MMLFFSREAGFCYNMLRELCEGECFFFFLLEWVIGVRKCPQTI